jgi:hypothetical protein
MWLLSQYSSQHCGVYTYILAVAEFSSSSINANRHRPLCPQLLLFLVHNYIPLAHNLDSGGTRLANTIRCVPEHATRVFRGVPVAPSCNSGLLLDSTCSIQKIAIQYSAIRHQHNHLGTLHVVRKRDVPLGKCGLASFIR